MSKKTIVKPGDRYNRLVVIEEIKSTVKDNRRRFRLLCNCGNVKDVDLKELRNNKTRSCGCYGIEIHRKSKCFASMTKAYNNYKSKSYRKGIQFDIDIFVFIHITQEKCHYCGQEPSNISSNPSRNGRYIYNGIDRVDNSKGYILDNIVPCCGNCNKAKLARTDTDFIEHCERIVEYQRGKQ